MNAGNGATFGMLLRRYRHNAGLTVDELAVAVGLSWRELDALERGEGAGPSADLVPRLADALRLAPADRAALEVAVLHAVRAAPGASSPAPGADAAPQAAIRGASNLPIPPTPLLGREEAVHQITDLLRREDVRLVTLTGPGGIGKSRLGMQIASNLLGDFADGVYYVRLSRLNDPALVVPTIASALELREVGGQRIDEVLRAYLRDKQLLLVLDNFEQILPAASAVAELLETSAGLRVLVTSRVPLHVRGEHEFSVTPLSVPDPARPVELDALSQYAAVALFIQRATDAKPDFAVTNANAPAIAAICARLDGLPLAIELAAVRAKLLPPSQLLARLEHRLPLLTGGARDLEERQRTMRATLAWSEDLLTGEERTLFRRLAVFVGGCTLETAEAVCVAPEEAEPLGLDLLDGLQALVDHNLVQQREEGSEARFGMLQVIREYALERLEASGEAEAVRAAHATSFLKFAEQAEPHLAGPRAPAWLARLEREHDNIRAVLDWTLQHAEQHELGLRLGAAAMEFWDIRGYWSEGRTRLERQLAIATGSGEATTETAARARALRAAGFLAYVQADYDAAQVHADQALRLACEAKDRQIEARALHLLGNVAFMRGEADAAAARYEAELQIARALGNRERIVSAIDALGLASARQGRDAAAEAYTRQALQLYRTLGDNRGAARALGELASFAYHRGDMPAATELYGQSHTLAREVGDSYLMASSLYEIGDLAYYRGDLESAERYFRSALELSHSLGEQDIEVGALSSLGKIRRRRCEWQRALAEGRDALVLALSFVSVQVRWSAMLAVQNLSLTISECGHAVLAAQMLGAVDAAREAVNFRMPEWERAEVEETTTSARAALGEERWAAEYRVGQALSMEQAIALALGEEGDGVHADE